MVVTVTAGFVRYGYYLKLLLPTVRFLHFTPPLTFSGAPCGTHDTYSEIHHCPSESKGDLMTPSCCDTVAQTHTLFISSVTYAAASSHLNTHL